ncbi:uncharacterized protein B0I36DRAFT_379555 [Microdochium trichocladiopsis]|uniref:Uncharacterized protein n=1 Tax=Microdochium trichocladiopsis TaxID=1682393 RepID=A0A9P8YIM4_9PEZI|nr:uncharacterized protein B0I36DRAFT_379555 [Microdochium trichocladiopsis]KAH7040623.1 hypothetical protein B0I36DRAFT_379555 [Microdochium trichocladiopsis]
MSTKAGPASSSTSSTRTLTTTTRRRHEPSSADSHGPPAITFAVADDVVSVAVVHNPQTCPEPFDPPRLVIRELLRTRYAAPGAILLVEAIDTACTSATGRWRTVRLLLGDGELCIQALLAVGLHRYVDTAEVAVGTYLRLDEFKLVYRTVGGSSASSAAAAAAAAASKSGAQARRDGDEPSKPVDGDRRKKKKTTTREKASGKMACLIIENMVPIGWNRSLIAMAEGWSAQAAVSASDEQTLEPDEMGTERSQADQAATSLPTSLAEEHGNALHKSHPTESSIPTAEHVTEDALVLEALADAQYMEDDGDKDLDDDDFEVMPTSQRRTNSKRGSNTHDFPARRTDNAKYPDQLPQPGTKPGGLPPAPPPPSFELRQPSTTITTSTATRDAVPTTAYVPPKPQPPPPPIKLTLLKSIPSLPYKQNWSVNVLAVVSAISALEPASLPPTFTQRQVRLADPTTPKHVLLTVFLDPEGFTPSVGSVVLLLGVKNHTFDGGSLKKYASDRPKAGASGGGAGSGGDLARVLATADYHGGGAINVEESKNHHGGSWWFENPVQFAWCDVAGLRKWWDTHGQLAQG